MSDFNYRGPEDPFRRDVGIDPAAGVSNTAWGWVAAAVFVVVILAVAFGLGHQTSPNGTNVAANQATPPAVTHMAPPAGIKPTAPPTPAPAAPAAPIAPAPNTPAHTGTAQ